MRGSSRPSLSFALAVAATLAISACAPRASTSPTPAADAETITSLLDSTAAGWNRGDLAAYMAMYADTTTSMAPTGIVRGKAATEQVMRSGFWRNGRPAQQLHYEHVEVRMLGADHALVTGEYVLTGAGRPDRTGWFTTIWARTDAGWRMIHDHS